MLAFEAEIRNSEAVIARYFMEALRLSLNDDELYATYFQQVEAKAKIPANDKWNRIRAFAEEALFPGYKADISFGCLTLTREGLPHYGNCSLVFKEDMIAHRTSILEENCVLWIQHRNVNLMADQLPTGYRAPWNERHKVAVAKLASSIDATTSPSSFAEILMRPKSTVASGVPVDDEFVEVHIWGPWTRRTWTHVVVRDIQATDPLFIEFQSGVFRFL